MNFFLGTSEIDLGNTSIENIFIDDFMPMATGTAVKVYLLGYKFACNKETSSAITNQTLAKHLRTSLDDILKAWDFWESKGVIKKHYVSDIDDNEYSVEFVNLKQLYIDQIVKPAQKNSARNTSYTCTPTDMIELKNSPAINNMFNNIAEIIGRTLSPNEYKKILEWLYNYNMSTDIITKAFEYSKEYKNIKSLNYVQGILKNWYDNKLTNLENLNAFLETNDKNYALFNKIKSTIGYKGNLSGPIKKLIDKWSDEWGYSSEIILYACQETLKISEPNFRYLDGIITKWNSKQLKTLDDIVEDKKQYTTAKQPSTNNTSYNNSNKSKLQFKTKFHNFKHTTTKYSDKELEDKLNKNLQRKLHRRGLDNLYNNNIDGI